MTLNKPTNGSGRDSRAQITSTTLFQHPDGGGLWVSSNGRIGITEAWLGTDEPDCAALNIAPQGMRLLAYRLLALAVELEGHTMIIHDSRNTESVTVLAEYMNESELVHEADALWIQNSADGQWACLPIEDADLIELGKRLQKLGRKLTKNTTTK